MAGSSPGGAASGARRWRGHGRNLAGRRSQLAGDPAGGALRLAGGSGGTPGGGHPCPSVLHHRFGRVQPGSQPGAGARQEPLYRVDGIGRQAVAHPVELLDLHGRRWTRDPCVVPRRFLSPAGPDHGARVPPPGHRLDRSGCVAGDRRTPVRHAAGVVALALGPHCADPVFCGDLRQRWDRRPVPPLPGRGGLAVGSIRHRERQWRGDVDRSAVPGVGLFHQADAVVLRAPAGDRGGARSQSAGSEPMAGRRRLSGHRGRGILGGQSPVHRLAAGRLDARDVPPVRPTTGGRRPGCGHPGVARAHRRGGAPTPVGCRCLGLCRAPGRFRPVVPRDETHLVVLATGRPVPSRSEPVQLPDRPVPRGHDRRGHRNQPGDGGIARPCRTHAVGGGRGGGGTGWCRPGRDGRCLHLRSAAAVGRRVPYLEFQPSGWMR